MPSSMPRMILPTMPTVRRALIIGLAMALQGAVKIHGIDADHYITDDVQARHNVAAVLLPATETLASPLAMVLAQPEMAWQLHIPHPVYAHVTLHVSHLGNFF